MFRVGILDLKAIKDYVVLKFKEQPQYQRIGLILKVSLNINKMNNTSDLDLNHQTKIKVKTISFLHKV